MTRHRHHNSGANMNKAYMGRVYDYTQEGKNEVWVNIGFITSGNLLIPDALPELDESFNRTHWPGLKQELTAVHNAKAMDATQATCCMMGIVMPCCLCIPLCYLKSKSDAYMAATKKVVADHLTQHGLPPEAMRVQLIQMSPTVPLPMATSDSNGIMCADGHGQPVWPPVGVNVVLDMNAMGRWKNPTFTKPLVPLPMMMAPQAMAMQQMMLAQQLQQQQQQNMQAGVNPYSPSAPIMTDTSDGKPVNPNNVTINIGK